MLRVIHCQQFAGFCPNIKNGWQMLMRAFRELGEGETVNYNPDWSPPQTKPFVDTLLHKGAPLAEVGEGHPGPLYVSPYGAPPDSWAQGARVIDATCPNVRLVQEAVRKLSAGGRPVAIAGEKGDYEPKMLQSWALGPSWVVSNPAEVWELPLADGCEVGLVSQTSFRPDMFLAIDRQLRTTGREVKVGFTRCLQIGRRVNAALELAKSSTYVVVVASGTYSGQLNYLVAQMMRQRHKIGSVLPVVAYSPENIGANVLGGLMTDTVIGLISTTVVPDDVVAKVAKRLESLGPDDLAEKPIYNFRPCHLCPDQFEGCQSSCNLVIK